MIYKITVDSGLMRENILQPAIRVLKQLETEGRIEIFESDRARAGMNSDSPPRHPAPRPWRKSDPSRTTFNQISAVMFPNRDPNRLNMTETNDVAHLMKHHSQGRNIFVTTNVRDFVADGRQQRLQSAFNIVVLTPDEAISALRAVTSR